MADSAFPLFGPLHLGLLLFTAGAPAILAWAARRDALCAEGIRWALAALLIGNALLSMRLGYLWRGGCPPDASLPMHLCDWALVACVAALITKNQRVFEVAYFWGLAGTFQGILTPDLRAGLPMLRYVTFFTTHCGIVVSVLYLTWGLRLRTEPGAVWRGFAWTQLYVLSAALVDLWTGANYGYLCAKPLGNSILDFFLPWPWYLLQLELLALLLYALLALPFHYPYLINWHKRGSLLERRGE